MTETPGGEPDPAVRASDAERDATIERLSAAAGDGRLTLEEFSQRMEQASSSRTRAELDRLVADLPAAADAAPSTAAPSTPAASAVAAPATAPVTAPAAGPARWYVSPIGGLHVRGPWRMDRHVIVASIIGGAHLNLSHTELAAREVTLTQVSIIGGVHITVPPGVRVVRSGFNLLGGTRIGGGPRPGPGAPTIHIRAFSIIGGVAVDQGRAAELTDRLDSRRERRRARRARFLD